MGKPNHFNKGETGVERNDIMVINPKADMDLGLIRFGAGTIQNTYDFPFLSFGIK